MARVAKRAPPLPESARKDSASPSDPAALAFSGQPSVPVFPGQLISGKYRVERVIGKGGMGVVAAAHDVALDRPVAIKFLAGQCAASVEFSARFRREARAMAKLANEHVVRVLDVGELPTGDPYMVMERLEGTDLSALVRKRGRLPLPETTDYVLQACEAIAEAHVLGIVHRDLKPSNMYLARRSDGTAAIKLLDFGIAKMPMDETHQTLTTATVLLGSPAYMSPEQLLCASNVDARADIWSLGAIIHTLLAGRPPFVGDTMPQVCALIVSGKPRPICDLRSDIPREIQNIIFRCLEKRPEDRFPNVAELAIALAPFAPQWAQTSMQRAVSMIGMVGDLVLDSDSPPAPEAIRSESLTSQSRARNHRSATPVAAPVPLASTASRQSSYGMKVAFSLVGMGLLAGAVFAFAASRDVSHAATPTAPAVGATPAALTPRVEPAPSAFDPPATMPRSEPLPSPAAPPVTSARTLTVPAPPTTTRKVPAKPANVDNREFGGRK